MNMYDICLLHARSDRALRAAIATKLEASRITMMEWLLLGIIADGPEKGCNMSEIARALHVTLPQVTALVNKLMPLKLVKQKSASTDRRSRLVSLTSKGRLVYEDSRAVLGDAQSKLLPFSAADMEIYLKVLTALSEQES